MYYEINVSKNGQHYFATAERSLTYTSEANEAWKDFSKRFPASEGFELRLSLCRHTSQTLKELTIVGKEKTYAS